MERVTRLASQRAVVIFSKSTCCMSHTIKTLFYDLGVNPTVHELDEEPRAGKEIEKALIRPTHGSGRGGHGGDGCGDASADGCGSAGGGGSGGASGGGDGSQ
ncbi:hypothetical protein C5167_025760 [Papaver somniferum]|uniref:Glutaredoxin domain-containing protein n=1 Tax=Papaver somniferum TaxID=3469 RepID=A0A4Y7JWA7_PAPSO|nr:hypothetical protein C5167_025760 [Papaver somniferum]